MIYYGRWYVIDKSIFQFGREMRCARVRLGACAVENRVWRHLLHLANRYRLNKHEVTCISITIELSFFSYYPKFFCKLIHLPYIPA